MRSLDRPNFKINKNTNSPLSLNYKTYGLYGVKTYDQGEISKVEYYSTYSNDEYSDLVVDETISYVKDSLGFFKEKIINIRWYLENNTIGAEKVVTKKFNNIESITEGVKKRENIISTAKQMIILEISNSFSGNDILTEAYTLLNDLGSEITLYIQGNKQPLIDAINSSNKSYIISIKSELLSEITY